MLKHKNGSPINTPPIIDSSEFPPTFITVAANDGIANVNTVERRVENLKPTSVEVEYRRYQTPGHSFGTGKGTDAEGWMIMQSGFGSSI